MTEPPTFCHSEIALSERNWEPVSLGSGFKTPVGAYSPVVRANGFLFVSGQLATDPATGEMQGSDITTQTRYVIAKLGRVLEAAGSSLSNVVSMTVYLSDMGNWEAFNAAYRASFPQPFPTRTTVGVELHGALIEITAVAVA
jgi:2-iminobutanoate/2-iminopropanoate deaminase